MLELKRIKRCITIQELFSNFRGGISLQMNGYSDIDQLTHNVNLPDGVEYLNSVVSFH